MPRPEPDYIQRANRRSDLHTEGVKGLMVLNGGRILALLTFITQITAKTPVNYALVQWVVGAIAVFAFGLILAASINHIRYETSRLYDNEETKPIGKWWGDFHRLLFCLSLCSFLIGVGVALIGILNNYPS